MHYFNFPAWHPLACTRLHLTNTDDAFLGQTRCRHKTWGRTGWDVTPGESPPGFHFLNVCGFIFHWALLRPCLRPISSHSGFFPSLCRAAIMAVKSHPALSSTLAHALIKRAKKWNQCMPDSLLIFFKSSSCWLWCSSRTEPWTGEQNPWQHRTTSMDMTRWWTQRAAQLLLSHTTVVLSSLSDISQSFPKPHSHRTSGVTWSKSLLQQGHLEEAAQNHIRPSLRMEMIYP